MSVTTTILPSSGPHVSYGPAPKITEVGDYERDTHWWNIMGLN